MRSLYVIDKILSQGKSTTWLLLREENQRDSHTDPATMSGFQEILNVM